MNTVTLNNGVVMPVLGLGVYQIDDASLCEQIVRDALRAGYRLIDTAAAYGNEEAVGRAVKRSGVPREDIFITTKVWVQDFGYEKTKRAVAASLEKLDMPYVDLVLLHQQLSDYYGSWRALQELCRQGTVRAIGVSNFYPDRLADLCENADILPAVNQIECHPFYQRAYDLDVMKKLRVAPMAWGPFAEGGHDIWNNPILKKSLQSTAKPLPRSPCALPSSAASSSSPRRFTRTGSSKTWLSGTSSSTAKTCPKSPPWTRAARKSSTT